MPQEVVSSDKSPTAAPVGNLVGMQLGQVWFVMDYVELVFDEAKLSCYVWPIVEVGQTTFRFGDRDYRNALCSLITKTVCDVGVVIAEQHSKYPAEQAIQIDFGTREVIRVSLLDDSSKQMDAAAYNDTDTSWLVW